MNAYNIYIRSGELTEDPKFHWSEYGICAGNSPKEAAINALKRDSLFCETSMTVWGWDIGYEDLGGNIIVINP